jgi:hypothetical protein
MFSQVELELFGDVLVAGMLGPGGSAAGSHVGLTAGGG